MLSKKIIPVALRNPVSKILLLPLSLISLAGKRKERPTTSMFSQIALLGNGPAQSTGFQGSGLAATVEVPVRVIRIEYPEMWSREKLRRYKDKRGKAWKTILRLWKEESSGFFCR